MDRRLRSRHGPTSPQWLQRTARRPPSGCAEVATCPRPEALVLPGPWRLRRRGSPIGQQIQWTPAFDVDQDGPVVTSFTGRVSATPPAVPACSGSLPQGPLASSPPLSVHAPRKVSQSPKTGGALDGRACSFEQGQDSRPSGAASLVPAAALTSVVSIGSSRSTASWSSVSGIVGAEVIPSSRVVFWQSQRDSV